MGGLLGWIGFLLFLCTLMPFVMRRFRIGNSGLKFFFTHYHHTLAIASLAVLILHGLSELTGRRGWQWINAGHFNGELLTGVISWLVMLSIVILALTAARKKPFPRTHCWMVGLLVLFTLAHIA